MHADVDDHVEARPCVCDHRIPQRGVERDDQIFEIRTLAARAEADPGRTRSATALVEASTPRFTQTPGPRSCKAWAIEVFPDRGTPFRMTI